MKKQREYWEKLIAYIVASEDVIKDIYNCDNDPVAAKAEIEERLKNLMDNYIIRRKPRTLASLLKQAKTPNKAENIFSATR